MKFAYKKDAEIVVRADLRTVACWPLQRQVAKHAPIQRRNASSLLPRLSPHSSAEQATALTILHYFFILSTSKRVSVSEGDLAR